MHISIIMYVSLFICIIVYMGVCVCGWVWVCVYVCVYIFIYAWVGVCVHIDGHESKPAIFLLYFHKSQSYTFCNYTYKFKMFKTYHSKTIYATLCQNMKKICGKVATIGSLLALLNNC